MFSSLERIAVSQTIKTEMFGYRVSIAYNDCGSEALIVNGKFKNFVSKLQFRRSVKISSEELLS